MYRLDMYCARDESYPEHVVLYDVRVAHSATLQQGIAAAGAIVGRFVLTDTYPYDDPMWWHLTELTGLTSDREDDILVWCQGLHVAVRVVPNEFPICEGGFDLSTIGQEGWK